MTGYHHCPQIPKPCIACSSRAMGITFEAKLLYSELNSLKIMEQVRTIELTKIRAGPKPYPMLTIKV